MSDKRTNRVTTFFSDSEFAALAIDADAVDREPANYLRWIWKEDRRKRADTHTAKVIARAQESENNQIQPDGSVIPIGRRELS